MKDTIYKNSALLLKEFDVEAFGNACVEFFDVKPNYFRVQNFGTGKVYFGTSRVPTDEIYDFACAADAMKMYAEPFSRGYLYVYNPTGSKARIKLIAFNAEFDPLALAMSDFSIDFSNMRLETATAIDSFNAPLPSGSNTIGKVTLGSLPAGSNSIGKVEFGTTAKQLIENLLLCTKTYERMVDSYVSSAGYSETASNGYRFNEITFFSNDGERDMQLALTYGENTQQITVHGGEVINNMKCYCDIITVSCPSGSNDFRLVCTERMKV